MSTTIDRKVVEMRFDNKDFEKNTRQSMSTLDKLKEKLNFTGATKGLENIGKATKDVDMNGFSRTIDTVHSKFSALEVVGVTAMVNIANSAVNAGKRMISALTVQPVSDGFKEYELMLNSVQTTMAGTGLTAQEVEEELKKLDEYADKTIYSTADMLNNLPKFTNAGVELSKATKAMIGIANATAHAGGDANKASIAFYNLGQAIGTGYLTRMDYNSINNAGIATMEWKERMVEAAIAAGTLEEAGDGLYKAGNKTLTLQQLFIDGLQEQWATADVLIKVFGDYGDETTDIGKRAYESAQNIKTFTMMMESLKATAGTGWKDTWQIIFGNLEDATKFWTGLTNFISNIITSVADFRNNFLRTLLYNPFESMMEKFETSGLGKAAKKVQEVTTSLEKYQKVVNKVWRGDYNNRGDNPDRYDLLSGEGYNPRVVQTLVNKGYKYKLTVEDVAAAEKQWGVTSKEASQSTKELSNKVETLTDKQLKEIGLTEEEIRLYRLLEKESRRTGKSIDEIVDAMSKKDARTLLIESLSNAGKGLEGILKAIGKAWAEIFPANPIAFYNTISALNDFSKGLVMSEETIDKLTRTFKGLFAILDIVTTLFGSGLKIAFTILRTVLGLFNIDILSFTAVLGDGIVKVRDFIDNALDMFAIRPIAKFIVKMVTAVKDWAIENDVLNKVLQFFVSILKPIGNYIVKTYKGVKNWAIENQILSKTLTFFKDILTKTVKGIKDFVTTNKHLNKALELLKSNFKKNQKGIKEWFEGLKEADNIGKYIIDGLIGGLKDGFSSVIEFISNIALALIDAVKKILGIHSPSTVMYAIGGFIIAGLIAGITNGKGELLGSIGEMFSGIVSFVKSIDFGAIFAGLIAAGLAVTAYKVASALQNFSKPFKDFGKFLDGFRISIDRVSKGISTKLKAEAFKSLAVSILILVGALYILTKIDTVKALIAVGILALLATILGGLSFVIGKWGPEDLGEFSKFTLAVLGIGAAMLLMAIAMDKIANIEVQKWSQVVDGLILFVMAFGVLIFAGSKLADKIDGFGTMILKIAGSMLIMAIVVQILGKMDPMVLSQGIIIMWTFMALIAAMMLATKLIGGGQNIDKFGISMMKMAGAMALMALVVYVMGSMDPEKISQGVGYLVMFGALIVGFMAATKLVVGSKNVEKIGKALLGIAGAIAILAIVAIMLSLVKGESLLKGVFWVGVLGAIIVGLMWATKLVGKDADKIAKTILTIAGAIAILAALTVLLGLVKIETLAKGIIAVGLLTVMVRSLIKATKDAKNCMATLIVITVAIAVLAGALVGLSFIDPVKLAAAAGALSAVMGMFTVIMKNTKSNKAAITTLLTLAGVVFALGATLYLIGRLQPEQSLAAAAGLSLLMGVLTGVLVVLSKLKITAKDGLQGALALLSLCIPLFAIALILQQMSGVQNAMVNAQALGLLIGVLSLALLPLSLVGAFFASALLGVVALLAMMAPLGTVALLLYAMQDIKGAMANAMALTLLMDGMCKLLVVCALAGPLALIGVTALTALTLLIVGIGVLVVAIGALLNEFPQLETFVDLAIPLLVKLAGGLGQMISAFMGGLMSSLPDIGMMLSQFMINATPFIVGIKMVDGDTLKNVGMLTAAILLLTAASFIEGITSFLPFIGSFSQLGTELSQFAINALPFFTTIMMVKPESLEAIKALAEAILILTAANLLDGINRFLGNGDSLERFSSQLPILGEGLKSFSSNLGTFTDDQVKTVDCAARALKSLAEAAKAIPNTGGYLADLVGNNDLGTFAAQLPVAGIGIAQFVKTITDAGITQESAETANIAADIIKTLATTAKEIPNTGGLLAELVGDNPLDKFASGLPTVAKGISGFVKTLVDAGITQESAETAKVAAGIIKTLAKTAQDIPDTGGLLAKLLGDNDLKDFAAKLPDVASGISGFANKLGTWKGDKLESVKTGVDAIEAFAKLGKLDLGTVGSNLNGFGNNMKKFGTKVGEFATQIASVSSENLSSAITKINDLVAALKTTAGTNITSLNTFGDSLKKLAKDGVTGFVKEFNGVIPKAKALKGAQDLVSSVVAGIKLEKDNMGDAFGEVAEAGINAISTKELKSAASSAGEDLASGFANGIKSRDSINKVTAAGTTIGKTALKAAKEAIDSNSPSKEAMKIGNFFGEGLVIGIDQFNKQTYNAGYDIGDNAKTGLSKAIAKVSALIKGGIDEQPTIRPVLDLTDVRNGVNQMSSLLNMGQSVRVAANLNAISSGMNAAIQNGSNPEVVSAIDKLRKDLGNIGGTTNNYNVGGVTYNDETNIANAVQDLIRAITVEGRM